MRCEHLPVVDDVLSLSRPGFHAARLRARGHPRLDPLPAARGRAPRALLHADLDHVDRLILRRRGHLAAPDPNHRARQGQLAQVQASHGLRLLRDGLWLPHPRPNERRRTRRVEHVDARSGRLGGGHLPRDDPEVDWQRDRTALRVPRHDAQRAGRRVPGGARDGHVLGDVLARLGGGATARLGALRRLCERRTLPQRGRAAAQLPQQQRRRFLLLAGGGRGEPECAVSSVQLRVATEERLRRGGNTGGAAWDRLCPGARRGCHLQRRRQVGGGHNRGPD
mmetsp:Transcript_18039/g.58125  ORF Transcript_18039/g.58125 Transcript_18039/m.58125 type:complete len:280 (+) Transcript_18039:961-1800(+)